MTAPVEAPQSPVQPLSPAKIAPSDPSSIVTALLTVVATVLQSWPGKTPLPQSAINVVTIGAVASFISLMMSKHLLSAAALTAATTPPSLSSCAPAEGPAVPATASTQPAGTAVDPAVLASQQAALDAQRASLDALEQAFRQAVAVLEAHRTPPPADVYPPAGVPIGEPTPGT